MIAGAAMLAGAVAPTAHGQDSADEVAFFMPRLSTSGAVLPRPLAADDAARLRRVFALQAQGYAAQATAEAADLGATGLLGHVLADRYLGGAVQPTAAELRDWLARYGGLPDAPAIHAALLARLPQGEKAPPLQARQPAPPPAGAAAPPLVRNPALDRSVHDPARAGRFDQALRLIGRTRGLSAPYGALLRAEVARAKLFAGRDAAALRLAMDASRQAKGRVGLAPYVAGLAAWRLGQAERAAGLFEAASRADLSSPAERSRAAFWAARAHLRLGARGSYALWMQRAAEQPRSFHGQLARRVLGEPPPGPASPARSVLGEADVAAVGALPGGRRAFALLQVGQDVRGAAELRQLWEGARDRPGLARALALVARAAELGRLADEMGAALGEDGIEPAETLPALRPAGGFTVSPALVYAMARLESNFDPHAVSPNGARGLMQLMPGTAGWMAGGAAKPAAVARRLRDPALNLALGQQYLAHLAGLDATGGSLLRVLAAYNAGPASLAHWSEAMGEAGDPLLFIELIPNDETRAYVPRALAYAWLYAARLNLPSPSLDALAAGRWPRFSAEIPPSATRAASLH